MASTITHDTPSETPGSLANRGQRSWSSSRSSVCLEGELDEGNADKKAGAGRGRPRVHAAHVSAEDHRAHQATAAATTGLIKPPLLREARTLSIRRSSLRPSEPPPPWPSTTRTPRVVPWRLVVRSPPERRLRAVPTAAGVLRPHMTTTPRVVANGLRSEGFGGKDHACQTSPAAAPAPEWLLRRANPVLVCTGVSAMTDRCAASAVVALLGRHVLAYGRMEASPGCPVCQGAIEGRDLAYDPGEVGGVDRLGDVGVWRDRHSCR